LYTHRDLRRHRGLAAFLSTEACAHGRRARAAKPGREGYRSPKGEDMLTAVPLPDGKGVG